MTQPESPASGYKRPMHDAMASGSMLVVLGGDVNDRPGFMLSDARLSLGAGEDDDVYLTGVGVVPGHLRLVFLEGRITLLSAVEEVRVDGQPITRFPFELNPLQAVSLGPDTHLAYGDAGSEWPSAPVWENPQAEPDLPASLVPVTAAGEEWGARQSKPVTRRDHVIRGARLLALALTAATAIVVGLVVTDVASGISSNVVPGEVAIDRSAVVLRQMLAADRESFGTVQLTERDDGVISLTGFVDSEDTYSRLAQQVRQQRVSSGGNVRMDVLTQERLEALVRDILSRFPLAARTTVSDEIIALTVYGVKLPQEIMDRIRSDLSRLSPRIEPRKLEIAFEVQEAEKFVLEISSTLTRSPATRDLRFEIDESGGHIVGVVPAALEREASAAAISILKTFESKLPLRISLKFDSRLNFNVVSLTQGGELPTATMIQRGRVQTFRVGESVFGVGELVSIRSDGVMLALGKREVFIPLNR